MKKILKISGLLIVLIFLGLLLFIWAIDTPLPVGNHEKQADELALKMLKALNYEAYQNTRFLEWSYQGGRHHYKWDKKLGTCEVVWQDMRVNLWLQNPEKSKVWIQGKEINDVEKMKIIDHAERIFNNDSFWLVAPYKVFDHSTKRALVIDEEGKTALLVTYHSGGSTPGDSYLWYLNGDYIPISYKMWVKIIPIGGLKATWEDWKTFETGVTLPLAHRIGPLELSMGEVKAYN